MIYDRTCRGRFGMPWLTTSWRAGAALYTALGRLDRCYGAASWTEALDWLAETEPGAPIREIQFWGHGNWGCAKIDGERLDESALLAPDPRSRTLAKIKERLIPGGEALWWFRTCETFGTERGHAFARAWSRFFGCRVAGHTYVIWLAQSGLHTLRPGAEPDWPLDEGLLPLKHGDPPAHARWSTPLQPNTVSLLANDIPDGW